MEKLKSDYTIIGVEHEYDSEEELSKLVFKHLNGKESKINLYSCKFIWHTFSLDERIYSQNHYVKDDYLDEGEKTYADWLVYNKFFGQVFALFTAEQIKETGDYPNSSKIFKDMVNSLQELQVSDYVKVIEFLVGAEFDTDLENFNRVYNEIDHDVVKFDNGIKTKYKCIEAKFVFDLPLKNISKNTIQLKADISNLSDIEQFQLRISDTHVQVGTSVKSNMLYSTPIKLPCDANRYFDKSLIQSLCWQLVLKFASRMECDVIGAVAQDVLINEEVLESNKQLRELVGDKKNGIKAIDLMSMALSNYMKKKEQEYIESVNMINKK